MEAWQKWWQMAHGSLIAAQILETEDEARSSVSRAYYTAYQAATALLLYAKQKPPMEREAWSHETTPELLKNLPGKMLVAAMQQNLSARLKDLYNLRLIADYQGEKDIDTDELRAAVRSASFVLKIVDNILPGE